jgi:hypothetical protein
MPELSHTLKALVNLIQAGGRLFFGRTPLRRKSGGNMEKMAVFGIRLLHCIADCSSG